MPRSSAPPGRTARSREGLIRASNSVLLETHRTSFMGPPAAGRKIVWRDVRTTRCRDGRVAEEWVISDPAERLLRARKR